MCIASSTIASTIILAFQVAAYAVHDPKLKDSLTAGKIFKYLIHQLGLGCVV